MFNEVEESVGNGPEMLSLLTLLFSVAFEEEWCKNEGRWIAEPVGDGGAAPAPAPSSLRLVGVTEMTLGGWDGEDVARCGA